MGSSEEIRRVIERWQTVLSEGDSESALGRLSAHPGTLVIGTDAAEWWHAQEAHAVWRRQIEELGAYPVSWDEVEAWEEGAVGWASAKVTVTWAEQTFDTRATYVLHLERGEWKVVQCHWSLPQRTRTWG